MTSARCLLFALALGSAVPMATTARAEPTAPDLASARVLFKEGRALREKGELAKALEKLRAAHALGQTPITGLELARTYVLVGKLVDAHEVSLGVARLPVASDETGRSESARAEAAKLAAALEPRLAKLVVSVKGLSAGTPASLSVDGETVPPEAVGEPRSADPGPHVAVLRFPSGEEVRAQVELKEGESRSVELDATAIPAPRPVVALPPKEAPSEPPPRSNALFVTGATVGGFGLLFGASFGVATLSTKSSLLTDCPGGACGPQHHDELSRAQTEATVATVSFVVAGVGAAAMVLDWLLRPKKEARSARLPCRFAREHGLACDSASIEPELGAGWVGVHGAF
jgi:hypothetical protein